MPVVFLAHDERALLPDFLRHYRALGPVSFVVLDDGSTDGTAEYLSDMPDVTRFVPAPGTGYATHKVEWRREMLVDNRPRNIGAKRSTLTLYECIRKIRTSEPDRFIVNPIHQMPRLNS